MRSYLDKYFLAPVHANPPDLRDISQTLNYIHDSVPFHSCHSIIFSLCLCEDHEKTIESCHNDLSRIKVIPTITVRRKTDNNVR